ncbi:MAG: hypothetical protein JSW55_01700 [Chloroflexota bacterium]|nr:MAG: hypothetical protein JSW55_01700 [Chloroflexota bacterium]
MIDAVLDYLASGDSFVAIEFLSQQDDTLAAAEVYNKALKQLYYEEKDIQAVVNMGRAGIQHSLSSAAAAGIDEGRARELKGRARAIAYNLASYTWPGWDEAGIELGRAEIAQGLDAAAASARLSTELRLDTISQSRSIWMLAAQQMAAGDLAEAAGNFKKAAELARTAEEPVEALLSDGFAVLASLLASPGDSTVEARYMDVKRQLSGEEDGQFFIEQLDTARRVFSS